VKLRDLIATYHAEGGRERENGAKTKTN